MRSLGLAFALALVAVGVAGCGAPPPADSGPPNFPADALMVLPSSSGGLRIEVRTDPQPPVRGSIRGQLVITGPGGEAVDGLDVAVVPWMPAHGHGTSVQPTVSRQDDGSFLVDQLYLYMAGTWELRTTISGAVADDAVAQVQVP
jgi:hypothetical protein